MMCKTTYVTGYDSLIVTKLSQSISHLH